MPNKHCRIIIASILFCAISFMGCKKEKDGNGNTNEELPEFTVLSYNVAGLPAFLSSSKPDRNTPFIAELINGYDVVHAQEDFNYHEVLLEKTTYPHLTTTSGTAGTGDGLNVFSKYSIQNLARVQWDTCADTDCFTPKGFAYYQIQIGGVTVDMYNVHANAQSTEAALFARRANTLQLYQYIEEHSAGRPVLVFGDFNSRYTRIGDTIRIFENLGLKDAWVEGVRGGNYPVLDGNSLADCDPDRSSASCEKVDKVFYRSNEQLEFSVAKYQLDDSRFYYNNDPTQPLSDHWPLFVTFKYKVK